jgi:hypothetical protein
MQVDGTPRAALIGNVKSPAPGRVEEDGNVDARNALIARRSSVRPGKCHAAPSAQNDYRSLAAENQRLAKSGTGYSRNLFNGPQFRVL